MNRSLVVAAWIALTLTLSLHAVEPPKSSESWVALEAENFRFISAVSSRRTLEIARDLLRLRAALGKDPGATYIRDAADRAAGIAALEKSLKLDPNGEEAAFYLAQLWAAEGLIAPARNLAQSLLARTSSESMKRQITGVLLLIETREVVALITEALENTDAGRQAEALALIDAALPKLSNEDTRKHVLTLRDRIAAEMRKR